MHKCLRLAVPWCDFCSHLLKIIFALSHWHALACSTTRVTEKRRKRRAVARTQSPLGEGCVPEGIAIPYSPSSGERQPATSRIHPSMMFSVSASRCLPKLTPFIRLTLQDVWLGRAEERAAILLQINHARIVAAAVVGAIVLPRFVSLGLANCLPMPTPLARTQSHRADGTGLLYRTQFFPRAQVLAACASTKFYRVNGIVNLSRNLPDKLSMDKIPWISLENLAVLSFNRIDIFFRVNTVPTIGYYIFLQ